MNTLDIIIIVIVLISGINGLVRGLIKTLFGLTALLIAVIVTWMFTSPISQVIIDETSFDEMISEQVVELLNIEEITLVNLDTPQAVQTLNDLALPGNIIESLVESYTPQLISSFDFESMGDYVGSSIAVMAVKALVFVVLFIIITITLNAVATLLDLIARLPVLKQMNRLGGLGLGVIVGVVIIWIAGIGLSFVISIQSTQALSELIETSVLAKIFYYNNPLQNYVMNIQSLLN